MTKATTSKQRNVLEHFWPDHLSGQEVRTRFPRGRNVTIVEVKIEPVFDKETNGTKEMVVVYFDGLKRGLVTNKTNGRRLAEMFGGDADGWIGKQVSIISAKRSNGTLGVDVEEAFTETDTEEKSDGGTV